jgi:hypothetical protein
MVDVGKLLTHDLGSAPLVIRVHEAEQEHHRDRTHAELLQTLHAATHGLLVERREDLASVVHALRDRDARPPACDGRRRGVRRVPDRFLVHAAHLDLVAVALGHQQAGRRAVHLDHRVVGGGRAVDEDVDLGAEVRQRAIQPIGELLEAVHDPDRLVIRRRRGLVEDDVTFGRHADEIGERPPDIHAHPVAHVSRDAAPEERLWPRASR